MINMIEVGLTNLIKKLRNVESYLNSHRPLELAAKIAKANILGRSAKGVEYTGRKFKPYVPKYKEEKQKKGYDVSTVNLRRKGIYLDNFFSEGDSKTRRLSPQLAAMGQATGLSKKRKHIGVNKQDGAETERVLARDLEIQLSK